MSGTRSAPQRHPRCRNEDRPSCHDPGRSDTFPTFALDALQGVRRSAFLRVFLRSHWPPQHRQCLRTRSQETTSKGQRSVWWHESMKVLPGPMHVACHTRGRANRDTARHPLRCNASDARSAPRGARRPNQSHAGHQRNSCKQLLLEAMAAGAVDAIDSRPLDLAESVEKRRVSATRFGPNGRLPTPSCSSLNAWRAEEKGPERTV